MRSKILIGKSPWLEMAADDWAVSEPSTTLQLVPLVLDQNYNYDLHTVDLLEINNSTAFLAWGPDFLNFQRLELLGELKKRGFKLPPLVHPSAVVSPTVRCLENTWIKAGAVIGPQVQIGLNICIGTNARIGAFSKIGNSAWIGDGAILGSWVELGSNAIVGQNVEVMERIQIGRQAYIEVPQRVDQNWPPKAFHIHASNLKGRILDSK